MPIIMPSGLPAEKILREERINVISETRALRQDIRPLRILLLNLMPNKIETETQFARVLGATPLQIDLHLMRTGSYTGKTTPEEHLLGFYKTLNEYKDQKFDGMIVTGAPVEHLDFEDVEYWEELIKIYEWAKSHVYQTLFICWAAQAALYHFEQISKLQCTEKQFGLFPHNRLCLYHPLTKGFDDIALIPVSRHTGIEEAPIAQKPHLTPLLQSEETGICLMSDDQNKRTFMFNHLEYDKETLRNEYLRDKHRAVNMPKYYFPDNDDSVIPAMMWRAHRNLFFSNWINQIYQDTPFDLNTLPIS